MVSNPGSIMESNECDGLVCIDSIHAAESVLYARRTLQSIPTVRDRVQDSVSVLLLLLPEDPQWMPLSHQLPWNEALRLSALSLRYHVNSSVLWRFRASGMVRLHDGDVTLVDDLSGFKDFNYYLFEHWLKICEVDTFKSIHFPRLRRYMLRNPRNFSPFHILLSILEAAAEISTIFSYILDELDFSDLLKQRSPAYRDFMVSAGILLLERGALGVADAPVVLQPFMDDILAFVEAT